MMDEFKRRDIKKLSQEFIANLSHSLRSPLTCAKEAIAVVSDGLCGPVNRKQARMLKIAMKHINRLQKTTEGILKQKRKSE